MSRPPLVSICIPAYKAARFLPETLASVRAQTFQDWELIITEDGSRDETESLVAAFAREGPQPVRYLRHDKNRGLPATRNTGFAAASGSVIAILDADDLWAPDHLASGLAALGDPSSASASFAPCEIFDSNTGARLGERVVPVSDPARIPDCIHSGWLIVQPSGALFTRAAFERTGLFDEALPCCNDLDYWIRLCRAGVALHFTGRETLRYRKHPDAMSSKSADLFADRTRVQIKHRDWSAIPVAVRRRRLRAGLFNAARMDARQRPARALKHLAECLIIPLITF